MSNWKDSESELISVIVPGHNYGHFISETLDSILNQTYKNWECLVIDNGSSDNTVDVVNAFIEKDTRFRVFSISKSTTSEARNFGISKSKGKYLLFLDSDDQIASGKMDESLNIFRQSPNTHLVYTASKYYDDGHPDVLRNKMNPASHDLLSHYEGPSLPLLKKMVDGNLFTICSPIIKKEKVLKIDGFNDSLNWVEDWDFYIRLLASDIELKFCGSDSSACFIRVHNRSLSKKNVKMLEQSIIVRGNLGRVLSNTSGLSSKSELITQNRNQIKFLHRSLYVHYLRKNLFKAWLNLYRFFYYDGNLKLFLKALSGLPLRKNVFE